MQNNLCRHCGGDLSVNKKCNVCSKPKQYICNSCGNETEEQIHSKCIMMDMDYTLLTSN